MAFHKLQSGDFMVVGYVPKDAELKKVALLISLNFEFH